MTEPDVSVTVHLVVGCQVYELGMVTTHPEVGQAALAALLRDAATEISEDTTEQQCPADG